MSTLAYGAVCRKRAEATQDQSTTTEPPGVKTYVDALAALVPAEVLVLHAFMVELTTSTKKAGGVAVTTIDDAATLKATFWVCIALSIVFFVAARRGAWKKLDVVRAVIPAAAFVLWTVVQKSTAWDAVSPDSLSEGGRALIGAAGALVLGLLAARLGVQLDKSPSQREQAPA